MTNGAAMRVRKKLSYTREALNQGRYTSIPNSIINESGLTIQERMAWIVIASHQWGAREASWPGIQRIADYLGVHERTAREYVHSLRDKGFLHIIERPGRTNIYELYYNTDAGTPGDNIPLGPKAPSLEAALSLGAAHPSPGDYPTPSPGATPGLEATPGLGATHPGPGGPPTPGLGARGRIQRKKQGRRQYMLSTFVDPASELPVENSDNRDLALPVPTPPGGRQMAECNGLAAGCDDPAVAIVAYLNEKAGTRFRPAKGTLKPVHGRLKEGFTPEECRLVIDYKVEAWGQDEKMREYLRPVTLFGQEKFPGYLSAAQEWERKGRPALHGKKSPSPSSATSASKEFEYLNKEW